MLEQKVRAAAAATGYCTSAACLRTWKIVFAAILFLEGVVFGYVAMLLGRFTSISPSRFRKTMSLVNIFGGGVFFATGLLHILPEAVEFLSGEGHAAHGAEAAAGAGHADHAVRMLTAVRAAGHEEHGHGFPTAGAVAVLMFVVFLFFDRVLFTHGTSKTPAHDDADLKRELRTAEAGIEEDGYEAVSDEEREGEEGRRLGFGSPAFATAAIVTAAIGVHAVLEAVAIGISPRWSTILNLFIAISAHRWATCMALGSRYAKGNLNFGSYTALVVGYALIAPIGVAIGAGLTGTSNTVQGVCFALSAGVFLYVGAFETPAEEFVEHTDMRGPKFAFYALGCGVMVAITAILAATGVH